MKPELRNRRPAPRRRIAGLVQGAAGLVMAGTLVASAPARSAPPPAAVASISASSPAVQAAIVAAVEKERTVFGGKTPVPGVLVGVWDARGGHYVHGFGSADLATGTPLSADDHYRIGSNTKTFVISVLLQLVDEGKLRLDDPLSRFDLGVTIPDAAHITVRELCDMRSGLFEAYDTPEIDWTKITPETTFDPRTLIGWAAKQKPYFPPGTAYKYSNTNYLILGLIIESITKDSVGDQIQKRLLEPFHLTQTSYPRSQTMPEPWAHGYAPGKNGGWEDVSNTIPVSLMGAAGEMVSDIGDMKRWVKLYVTGRTSAAATQRERMDCIPTGEGNVSFGPGIVCTAGWYGYTGGLPGYNTAAYYLPAEGITIIAFVTLQANAPPPGVANTIFRDLAGIMSPKRRPMLIGGSTEQRAEPVPSIESPPVPAASQQ